MLLKRITLIGLTALLAACAAEKPRLAPPSLDNQGDKEVVAEFVLKNFQRADLTEVAKVVHPDKGVRFTPNTFVNTERDLIFTADKFPTLFQDQTIHIWGLADGSGLPIEMTFGQYFGRYIFDHDYTQAKEINWNQKVERGNTIDNAADIYPGAEIVEYHFPGFEERFEGMDWRSLRLVLEKLNGNWYLVGIIHDEWTI